MAATIGGVAQLMVAASPTMAQQKNKCNNQPNKQLDNFQQEEEDGRTTTGATTATDKGRRWCWAERVKPKETIKDSGAYWYASCIDRQTEEGKQCTTADI
jgi:hypothetical protein